MAIIVPAREVVEERCHSIHWTLSEWGYGGRWVARKEVEDFIFDTYTLSARTMRRYIDWGCVAGLWETRYGQLRVAAPVKNARYRREFGDASSLALR